VIVKWGSPPKFHGDPDILNRTMRIVIARV
jgi:hypothetical protein